MCTDHRQGQVTGYAAWDARWASVEVGVSGGKIQPGESREEALVREIREELEIGIAVGSPLEPVSHAYAGKEIILYPFLCRWTEGELILREHHAALWVSPEETAGMDMLEADRKMLTTGQNMARLKLFACS